VIILVVIRQPFGPLTAHSTQLNTSDFVKRIQQGTIHTIVLERNKATGNMDPQDAKEYRDFWVELPPSDQFYGQIMAMLRDPMIKGTITVKTPNPVITETMQNIFVSVLIPLGAIVVLWILFWRQAQSTGNQALNFGRSKAKRLTDNVPKVTFDDVAGVEEAKTELQEVVEF